MAQQGDVALLIFGSFFGLPNDSQAALESVRLAFSGEYTARGPRRLRPFWPTAAGIFMVMVSATLWILGRFHVTQLEVLFCFQGCLSFCCPAFVVKEGKSNRTAHCGMNRSAVRASSKVAATAVMMPLVFAGSAFSSHRIEIVGRSAAVSTATRVFLRLLIAELYALFLFWHCFLSSCLWFVSLSVVRPVDQI